MRGFPLLSLVATSLFVVVPGSGADVPANAPSPEEHAARALERLATAPPQAVAASGEGMIETGRFEFPQLFRPGSRIETIGGGYLAALNRRDHVVVLDSRSGSVVSALDFDRATTTLAVGRKGGRVLGVVASKREYYRPQPSHVIDFTDPRRPEEIAVTDPCGYGALVLPGGEAGLVYGSECATLFDLDSGSYRAGFGRDVRSAAAATVGEATMLFLLHGDGWSQRPGLLRGWDVSNPAIPILVHDRELEPGGSLMADRRGEVLLHLRGASVTVLDLGSSLPLAVISLPDGYRGVALADSGGVRILAVVRDGAVDLYDLGDPAGPFLAGTLPIQTVWRRYRTASPPVLPHPDLPWLAFATADPGGVEVVDLRSLTSLLSYRVEGTLPHAIAWTVLADGSPAVAISGFWDSPEGAPRPEGGVTFTETLAVAPAGPPNPAARYVPVVPEEITAAVPLGGRWIAVVDGNANAVVLVDTADWTVVQTTGLRRFLDFADRCVQLDANETTFAIGDSYEGAVFDLMDGSLVQRAWIENPWTYLSDLAVLPDGTVLAFWGKLGRIQFIRPSGEVDEMEVPTGYRSLAVSPDGRRGALHAGRVWIGSGTPVAGVDLVHRVVLWEKPHGVAFAGFVRGGAALAATTVRSHGWYGPLLLDPETGEPLGPQLDVAAAFFYLAPGAPFGRGEGERLPYWHWTLTAWESSVFDISGDSARLVGVSEEYVYNPIHLPRDDGRSGLEFRVGGTKILSPDGVWSDFGPAPARDARRMRHGFFSGIEGSWYDDPQTIVLLRDPGVNRPPEARAGDDRIVECAGPSDTPVTLDGSASSDPDSTPGTSDDLAAFAWTVDGVSIGSDPRVETSLSRGIHVASLEVRDVLDAAASDQASIEIRDTLPPEVSLSLHPFLRGDRLWAHEWTIETRAEDRCDGTVEARALLPLGAAVLDAPVTWVKGRAEAIEVVATRRGLEVFLIGPDRSRLEAIWSTARKDGGLSPAEGAVRMELRDPPSRGLLAAYTLDASGRVTSAAGFGPEADLPVAASARDSSGWVGVAETSLRREIDRVCRELPANLACR